MPRRIIDISSTLRVGIASDPPHMLPKIEYRTHHDTAPAMAALMGVLEAARIDVVELHVQKASLEDVFLELTTGQ